MINHTLSAISAYSIDYVYAKVNISNVIWMR
jgi:hypothetical protein